jgi:hypothetical protein
MNIQNKFSVIKDEKGYSDPAKSIKQYLSPILSHSSKLRIRWIWELLQNASDLGDNIKVRIEIESNKLTYSHNGKNFSLAEGYNLIRPDSSKDNENAKRKSVIGQFGTGFVSTHILSRIILVEGIVEDEGKYYSFHFNLDRSERTEKDVLIESIKKSEAEYLESLKEINELPVNEFKTSFTYNIDNTYSNLIGMEIVNDGIQGFKELIPFVLTFRPQLAEIEVIDRRTTITKWKFKRDEVESNIEDLKIIRTICHKDDTLHEIKLTGKIIEEETEIAFPIEAVEDGKFRLLPFPNECPKLFCAFPMIGTGSFNFPVVVHSEKFVPNRERDGIELTEYDQENRGRLVAATTAYKRLLEIAEVNEWREAYNICSFKYSDIDDAITQKWFVKEIFNPIIDGIKYTKLVELDGSLDSEKSRITLSSAFIPYADRRIKDKENIVSTIYNFAFQIMAEKMPGKDHYMNWYKMLDFEIFDSVKLDFEKLCEKISPRVDLMDFSEIKKISVDKTIQYFIDLVGFLIEHGQKELLSKYNLLLNQKNEFTKIKGLKLDRVKLRGLKDGYDEKLKDIYFSLSKNECREYLLHKDFEIIVDLIDDGDIYDFKELAKETDEELRNFEGNFNDEKYLLILKDLFNWFTNCELSDETLKSLFPYFSINKSQLYLNTKTPKELEYAFDIEISGKSEVLAKIANTSLSQNELEMIADNPELVLNFIEWLNDKFEDNPDEELGNIGEEYLYHRLCQIFGKTRVLWEDKSEYDFRVLESDLITTKYYIDAKTTGKGIANSENVPFFMRTAQWNFLDKQQANGKYLIARIFKNKDTIDVKFIMINKQSI